MGFFITNPKYEYENKADVKFHVDNIGKPFFADSKPEHFEKRYREIWILMISKIFSVNQAKLFTVKPDVEKHTNYVT